MPCVSRLHEFAFTIEHMLAEIQSPRDVAGENLQVVQVVFGSRDVDALGKHRILKADPFYNFTRTGEKEVAVEILIHFSHCLIKSPHEVLLALHKATLARRAFAVV